MSEDLNLDSLFKSVRPSIVTPHLGKLSTLSSEKKLREIAKLIIESMAKTYNDSEQAKIAKSVLHDNEIQEFHYLRLDSLLVGVWPSISLMLLQLSYGEQSILIDSLYPKNLRFPAKTFAFVFTPEKGHKVREITVKGDPEVQAKLDSANAGIALILSELENQGYRKPHSDYIKNNLEQMQLMAQNARKEIAYKKRKQRAKEMNKYRDKN